MFGEAQSWGLGPRLSKLKLLVGMKVRHWLWWWQSFSEPQLTRPLPMLTVGAGDQVRSCGLREPTPCKLDGSPASLGHRDTNLQAWRGGSAAS